MTVAVRHAVSVRPAASLRSTDAAPADPVKPAAVAAALRVAISAETLARIEAVLVLDRGETSRGFIEAALLAAIEGREAARAFRTRGEREGWLGERDVKPQNVAVGCSGGCSAACAHVAAPSSEVARAVESFGPWPPLGEPCT